jgi:adenylosuccinate lyase
MFTLSSSSLSLSLLFTLFSPWRVLFTNTAWLLLVSPSPPSLVVVGFLFAHTQVNPIDFENAEGNLGLANALLSHLSCKLPISRMQRDLTDSTVWRAAGMPFAHTLLAFRSLERGLGKLWLRTNVLKEDLERNFVVVAEPVQTILRREGVQGAYEKLKDLTRTGERLNQARLNEFVDTLDVSAEVKAELKAISPHTYIGYPPVLEPLPDLVTLIK